MKWLSAFLVILFGSISTQADYVDLAAGIANDTTQDLTAPYFQYIHTTNSGVFQQAETYRVWHLGTGAVSAIRQGSGLPQGMPPTVYTDKTDFWQNALNIVHQFAGQDILETDQCEGEKSVQVVLDTAQQHSGNKTTTKIEMVVETKHAFYLQETGSGSGYRCEKVQSDKAGRALFELAQRYLTTCRNAEDRGAQVCEYLKVAELKSK